MFRRGDLFFMMLTAVSAFGYDLNVTASSRSLYAGEPVQLTYAFTSTPSDAAVDFRFAAPELTHFQVLDSRTEEAQEGGKDVWKKIYVVAPLQGGEVSTGMAAMNVAKRTYKKDAWGQWMPSVAWEQHRFGDAVLFASPVPMGISAVGRFTMTASTDRNGTDSGKPVRLTLSLKGCGNLQMADLPVPTIAGVSVFEEGRAQRARWQDGCYYSESNQTFALVAGRDFVVPSIVFRTFDPQRNAVVTAQTLPIGIHVRAAPQRGGIYTGGEKMRIWSLAAGVVIGFGIGVAATLLLQRRKNRERRVRYDSLRAALIVLFKHLDDPEAKKSAEAVEKHLYEGGPAPDAAALSATVERLKRGETYARREA